MTTSDITLKYTIDIPRTRYNNMISAWCASHFSMKHIGKIYNIQRILLNNCQVIQRVSFSNKPMFEMFKKRWIEGYKYEYKIDTTHAEINDIDNSIRHICKQIGNNVAFIIDVIYGDIYFLTDDDEAAMHVKLTWDIINER